MRRLNRALDIMGNSTLCLNFLSRLFYCFLSQDTGVRDTYFAAFLKPMILGLKRNY